MTFPLVRRYRASAPPVALAADASTIVDAANEAEVVSAVWYTPAASQAGVATNNRQVTLYNRAGGAGAVVVARATLSAGVNLVDNVPFAVALSGTPGNLVLAAGDVLEWESLHVGTGIPDPGGLVRVDTARVVPL